MHIYEQPPRLASLANVPPELDTLVATLLAKSPSDRPPSAAYTLAALERVPLPALRESVAILDSHTRSRAETYAPPGAYTQYLPPPRPPSRAFPIVVVLIALAAAAAAIYFIGLAD